MARQERLLRRGIRLFKHPVLDWASRAHPLLPALLWGPLVIAFFWYGVASIASKGTIAIGLLIGFCAWILTEYAIHRWFFHFRPRSAAARRFFYYVHEHHHRYQEWDRLLAPPMLSLSIAAVLLPAIYLTVGRWLGLPLMCVFLTGYSVGYLVYDYTHLYLHFARPRTRWGRYLRRCHLEHHFARPDRWFCISFPPLDFLFLTHRRRSEPSIPEQSRPDGWDSEQHDAVLRLAGKQDRHEKIRTAA